MADIVQYVQAGACVRAGGAPGVFGMVVRCALEREDCEGAIFRSSRELLLEGPTAVGYVCLERTIDTPVGRCQDDPSNVCTGSAKSCVDESGFYSRAEDCSMLVDTSPERQQVRTVFGGCSDDGSPYPGYCYWSESDCDTTQSDEVQWIAAGLNDRCTCEKVLTGACVNNGNYYCAVSELGCDIDSTFIPAGQLPRSMTCWLCEKQDESVIELKATQVANPIDSTPQITSDNQPATQDSYPTSQPVVIYPTESPQGQPTSQPVVNYPTESPQGQPTASPENNLPTAKPSVVTQENERTKATPYGESVERNWDYTFIYVVIPTVLVLNILAWFATSCGSNNPKQQSTKEEEDLVPNSEGELA